MTEEPWLRSLVAVPGWAACTLFVTVRFELHCPRRLLKAEAGQEIPHGQESGIAEVACPGR